jgi:hypothetical protein
MVSGLMPSVLCPIQSVSRYENGEIIDKDIEKIAKKETLARETIQRKLKILVKIGIVTKLNNEYSLSEVALSEIRISDPYMAKKIGSNLLINLLFQYIPAEKDLKERVKDIISLYGFYLLLSLIEACRPIDIQNQDKPIDNKTKDAIAYEWFKNSIDPVLILGSFISNFARDYGRKERSRFIKKSSHLIEKITAGSYEASELKKRFNWPFSGVDSYYIYVLENLLQEGKPIPENISRPNYEISQKRVDDIKSVMHSLFPDLVMAMEISNNSLLDLNKETYLKFRD